MEGVTSFFSSSLDLVSPGVDSPRSDHLGGPHPAPCRLRPAWSPSPLPSLQPFPPWSPALRESPAVSALRARREGGSEGKSDLSQGCQVPGPRGPQVSGEASPFGLRPPSTCPLCLRATFSQPVPAPLFQPTSSPCRSMANLSILFGQVSCSQVWGCGRQIWAGVTHVTCVLRKPGVRRRGHCEPFPPGASRRCCPFPRTQASLTPDSNPSPGGAGAQRGRPGLRVHDPEPRHPAQRGLQPAPGAPARLYHLSQRLLQVGVSRLLSGLRAGEGARPGTRGVVSPSESAPLRGSGRLESPGGTRVTRVQEAGAT